MSDLLDYDKLLSDPLDQSGTYHERQVTDLLSRLRFLREEYVSGALSDVDWPRWGFPLASRAADLTGSIARGGSQAANVVNAIWREILFEGYIAPQNGKWVPQVPPKDLRQQPIIFPPPKKKNSFLKTVVQDVTRVAVDPIKIVAAAPVAIFAPKVVDKKLGLTPEEGKISQAIGIGTAVVVGGIVAAHTLTPSAVAVATTGASPVAPVAVGGHVAVATGLTTAGGGGFLKLLKDKEPDAVKNALSKIFKPKPDAPTPVGPSAPTPAGPSATASGDFLTWIITHVEAVFNAVLGSPKNA